MPSKAECLPDDLCKARSIGGGSGHAPSTRRKLRELCFLPCPMRFSTAWGSPQQGIEYGLWCLHCILSSPALVYAAIVASKRRIGTDSSVNILCRTLCIVSIFSSRLLEMCERHAICSVLFKFYRRVFSICAVAMQSSLYRSTGDLYPLF